MDVNPLYQTAVFVQTKVKELTVLPGVSLAKKWTPRRCEANGREVQPYVQRLNLRMLGLDTVPAWALVAQPKSNPDLTGLADIVTSTGTNLVLLTFGFASFTFSEPIEYKGMPIPIDQHGPFDLWLLTAATSIAASRWYLQLQYSPIAGDAQ